MSDSEGDSIEIFESEDEKINDENDEEKDSSDDEEEETVEDLDLTKLSKVRLKNNDIDDEDVISREVQEGDLVSDVINNNSQNSEGDVRDGTTKNED